MKDVSRTASSIIGQIAKKPAASFCAACSAA